MGIRAALRLSRSAKELATAGYVDLPSPATSTVLPADVALAFGINPGTDTITRREAMTVPAVKRGRMVLAGTIGTLPLVAVRTGVTGGGAGSDGSSDDVVERRLLEQPDPRTTRAWTVTWTVDDLIFSGIAWWRVLDRDATGYPIAAERVDPSRVGINLEHDPVAGRQVWRVRIDGDLVDDADVIRFDGPDEGVLVNGATTLRTCLQLEAAVRNFARLDVPLGSLEPAEGAAELDITPGSAATEDDPDRSEVDAAIEVWEAMRAKHSTAYMHRMKYSVHQLDSRQQQIDEHRKHQRAEVANLLNLAPKYVAGSTGDSLTYSTTEADRRELVDLSYAPYLAAIAGRLSLGDVTPRGQRVVFDLAAFLRGDLTAVTSAIDAGITDAGEARSWLGLRPRTDLPPRPAATPAREDPTP